MSEISDVHGVTYYYDLDKDCIGKGQYGAVYACIKSETEEQFAVKICDATVTLNFQCFY